MARQSFELKAQPRNQMGTTQVRRLRRAGNVVPGILYASGQASQPITLAHNELAKALSNEAIFTNIITLTVNGESHKVVIKDLLRHHTKPHILHIDFKQIKANEKLIMEIPIHYLGGEECPGVKVGNGVVSHLISEVKIKCLPADLPEYLEVDISHLELDQTLHLSDLPLPAGVELTIAKLDEEHNLPMVSVHVPKVSKEDLAAEAAEAALAAGAAAESGEGAAEGAPAAEKAPAEAKAAASEKEKKE